MRCCAVVWSLLLWSWWCCSLSLIFFASSCQLMPVSATSLRPGNGCSFLLPRKLLRFPPGVPAENAGAVLCGEEQRTPVTSAVAAAIAKEAKQWQQPCCCCVNIYTQKTRILRAKVRQEEVENRLRPPMSAPIYRLCGCISTGRTAAVADVATIITAIPWRRLSAPRRFPSPAEARGGCCSAGTAASAQGYDVSGVADRSTADSGGISCNRRKFSLLLHFGLQKRQRRISAVRRRCEKRRRYIRIRRSRKDGRSSDTRAMYALATGWRDKPWTYVPLVKNSGDKMQPKSTSSPLVLLAAAVIPPGLPLGPQSNVQCCIQCRSQPKAAAAAARVNGATALRPSRTATTGPYSSASAIAAEASAPVAVSAAQDIPRPRSSYHFSLPFLAAAAAAAAPVTKTTAAEEAVTIRETTVPGPGQLLRSAARTVLQQVRHPPLGHRWTMQQEESAERISCSSFRAAMPFARWRRSFSVRTTTCTCVAVSQSLLASTASGSLGAAAELAKGGEGAAATQAVTAQTCETRMSNSAIKARPREHTSAVGSCDFPEAVTRPVCLNKQSLLEAASPWGLVRRQWRQSRCFTTACIDVPFFSSHPFTSPLVCSACCSHAWRRRRIVHEQRVLFRRNTEEMKKQQDAATIICWQQRAGRLCLRMDRGEHGDLINTNRGHLEMLEQLRVNSQSTGFPRVITASHPVCFVLSAYAADWVMPFSIKMQRSNSDYMTHHILDKKHQAATPRLVGRYRYMGSRDDNNSREESVNDIGCSSLMSHRSTSSVYNEPRMSFAYGVWCRGEHRSSSSSSRNRSSARISKATATIGCSDVAVTTANDMSSVKQRYKSREASNLLYVGQKGYRCPCSGGVAALAVGASSPGVSTEKVKSKRTTKPATKSSGYRELSSSMVMKKNKVTACQNARRPGVSPVERTGKQLSPAKGAVHKRNTAATAAEIASSKPSRAASSKVSTMTAIQMATAVADDRATGKMTAAASHPTAARTVFSVKPCRGTMQLRKKKSNPVRDRGAVAISKSARTSTTAAKKNSCVIKTTAMTSKGHVTNSHAEKKTREKRISASGMTFTSVPLRHTPTASPAYRYGRAGGSVSAARDGGLKRSTTAAVSTRVAACRSAAAAAGEVDSTAAAGPEDGTKPKKKIFRIGKERGSKLTGKCQRTSPVVVAAAPSLLQAAPEDTGNTALLVGRSTAAAGPKVSSKKPQGRSKRNDTAGGSSSRRTAVVSTDLRRGRTLPTGAGAISGGVSGGGTAAAGETLYGGAAAKKNRRPTVAKRPVDAGSQSNCTAATAVTSSFEPHNSMPDADCRNPQKKRKRSSRELPQKTSSSRRKSSSNAAKKPAKRSRKCTAASVDVQRRRVLAIIDGSCLAFRSHYGMPEVLDGSGIPVQAILGFFRSLSGIKKALLQPSNLIVVFDSLSSRTSRLAIYDGYKGHRSETPPTLQRQFLVIMRLCHALGVCTISEEGVEADDVIATLVRRACLASRRAAAAAEAAADSAVMATVAGPTATGSRSTKISRTKGTETALPASAQKHSTDCIYSSLLKTSPSWRKVAALAKRQLSRSESSQMSEFHKNEDVLPAAAGKSDNSHSHTVFDEVVVVTTDKDLLQVLQYNYLEDVQDTSECVRTHGWEVPSAEGRDLALSWQNCSVAFAVSPKSDTVRQRGLPSVYGWGRATATDCFRKETAMNSLSASAFSDLGGADDATAAYPKGRKEFHALEHETNRASYQESYYRQEQQSLGDLVHAPGFSERSNEERVGELSYNRVIESMEYLRKDCQHQDNLLMGTGDAGNTEGDESQRTRLCHQGRTKERAAKGKKQMQEIEASETLERPAGVVVATPSALASRGQRIKGPYVRIMQLHRKLRMVDEHWVLLHFGVLPHQLCDYLALVGDTSDSIEGCEGIGGVTARKLIMHSNGRLEELLSDEQRLSRLVRPRQLRSLLKFAPLLHRNRQLISLDTNVESMRAFSFSESVVRPTRSVAASRRTAGGAGSRRGKKKDVSVSARAVPLVNASVLDTQGTVDNPYTGSAAVTLPVRKYASTGFLRVQHTRRTGPPWHVTQVSSFKTSAADEEF